MADNYLEKKFEEYQKQKAGAHRPAKLTPSGARPGTVSVKFPPRRVFVTGGSNGIGKAIVAAFVNAGCKVAFCDIDEKAGRATAETCGAQFHPVDVTDASALEACMDRIIKAWGDIDIIINNVGVFSYRPITEISLEEYDRVIATNLRPAFITSRRLARRRQSLPLPNPYGRIINICSSRWMQSEPGTEAYASSKGGILSLTHALALSLADFHITVNCISPGWIETGDYSALRPDDHLQHPSQRVGRPEDIARMCVVLCEEGNDFINGENITIDGGMTKKMIYIE